MPKNKTIQGKDLHVNMGTPTVAELSAPTISRAERFINLTEKTFSPIIKDLNQAAFFEICEGYLHDPLDNESQVYATVWYNDVTGSVAAGDPEYYVLSSTLNRVYTCKDFKDLAELINSPEAHIKQEVNRRIVVANNNLHHHQ